MSYRAVKRRAVFVDAEVARAHFASLKRDLRRQLLAAFRARNLTKAAIARQFSTSRNAIYRLLGETQESSNLRSLAGVLHALDARITIRLIDVTRQKPPAR